MTASHIISYADIMRQYAVEGQLLSGLIAEEVLFPTDVTTANSPSQMQFLLSDVTTLFGKEDVGSISFPVGADIDGTAVYKIFGFESEEEAAKNILNHTFKVAGQTVSIMMIGENVNPLHVYIKKALNNRRGHWPADKAQGLFSAPDAFGSFFTMRTAKGMESHVSIESIIANIQGLISQDMSLSTSAVAKFFGFPENHFKALSKVIQSAGCTLSVSNNNVNLNNLIHVLEEIQAGNMLRPKYMPQKGGGCLSEILFWLIVIGVVAYESDIHGARKHMVDIGNWWQDVWMSTIWPWILQKAPWVKFW